ncbi:unnamed protein product, partial [Rotaria sp. Silwood2]
GKSRSRSRTPPYWRSTVKDRQRQHIHKEKDDNNAKEFNDENDADGFNVHTNTCSTFFLKIWILPTMKWLSREDDVNE